MHRSRLGVLLIDHPAPGYETAATFWSAATGHALTGTVTDDDPYQSLGTLPGGELLELQRTGAGTPPRVHLDVETDDVPAEVARLVALGATVVEEPEGYAVLHDPSGLVFCVVPVQTGSAFDAHATTWD